MKRLFMAIVLASISSTVWALPAVDEATQVCWITPDTRADGNPLSVNEIGGYFLYWKTATSAYTDSNKYDIANNQAVCELLSVTALPDGIHQLTMTAYDVNGIESGFSNEAGVIVTGGKFLKGLNPISATTLQLQ